MFKFKKKPEMASTIAEAKERLASRPSEPDEAQASSYTPPAPYTGGGEQVYAWTKPTGGLWMDGGKPTAKASMPSVSLVKERTTCYPQEMQTPAPFVGRQRTTCYPSHPLQGSRRDQYHTDQIN